jgi:hypothetical protein
MCGLFIAAHHENLTISISVLALFVSLVSLGWNVYRDLILKPRLQIELAEDDDKKLPKLTVTNRGPGQIQLMSPVVKLPYGWFGLLSKIDDVQEARPFGIGPVPVQTWSSKTLQVGGQTSMLLDHGVIKQWRAVGIRDAYKRIRWASDEDLEKVKRAHRNQT